MKRLPAHQRGMSLVEILVAITLGLLLVAALVQMFASSNQGYRLQTSSGRLQENARFATDYLAHSIRQADFWDGVKPEAITDFSDVADPNAAPCTEAWMAAYTFGVQGWDGATASPLLECTGGDYVADSDVLVLRYADPDDYISTDILEDPANTDDELSTGGRLFVRTQVGATGLLFHVTNRIDAIAALPSDGTSPISNYRYSAQVFYLKTQNDVPTLYRRRLQDSETPSNDPLVDGVEQLKFLYGIDSNDDEAVDRYLSASALTPSQWAQVVMVRLTAVIRGDALDQFKDENSYPMTPSYSFTPASEHQHLQRRLFVEDIQIRNRVRS